ncbi:MAG TPA: heavy metal sensor histidine kinase [Burkholderiaceae bacterium]|nr:heavy metal sensor histidine kinase [Burkholderiaceae bacterium]
MLKTRVSLTARLSLLFAGSIAVALFVCGMLSERAVEGEFYRHDGEELDGKMQVLRETLGDLASYETIALQQPLLHNTVTAGHPFSSITIVANDGAVLLSMGQPRVVKHLLEDAEFGKSELATWSADNRTYRILADRVPLGVPASQPAKVAIAFDITSDRAFIAKFRKLMWSAIGVGTLVMGLIGWIAVRKGLLPLRKVSAILANVSTSKLDTPIPSTSVPSDLEEVTSSFNRMLARLNDSFRRLSEFSSDIAHELRTPINNMMLQTQVALSRKRDAEEYCANLQSNLEELRRLSRMIEDMLFLANADNHLLAPRMEAIDLGAEVEKLVDFFEIAASEQLVRLVQSGDAPTIWANRLMLQRALSNLLSNALRFTTRGMAIEIDVRQKLDMVSVSVTNPGPEISGEHLPKIFDRLYRVDASRREGQTVNVGLGLAITKTIIEIHGGTVTAESGKGRTRFTVCLPHKSSTSDEAPKIDRDQGAFLQSDVVASALST